jgi:hypothetical protein
MLLEMASDEPVRSGCCEPSVDAGIRAKLLERGSCRGTAKAHTRVEELAMALGQEKSKPCESTPGGILARKGGR